MALLIAAAYGFVLNPMAPTRAQAIEAQELIETSVQDLIEKGIAQFELGEFASSLDTLEKAMHWPEVAEDQLVEIHKYRGASLAELGREKEAISELRKARKIDQELVLDEMEFGSEVLAVWKKAQKKPWYMRKWVWATTGVVLGGGIAAAFAGGGGDGAETGSLTVYWGFEE
ncbi:hypothetical protein ACFL4G_05530 [Thermodesulfobacteriota bacterium]